LRHDVELGQGGEGVNDVFTACWRRQNVARAGSGVKIRRLSQRVEAGRARRGLVLLSLFLSFL